MIIRLMIITTINIMYLVVVKSNQIWGGEKNSFEFLEYSERPIVIGFENGFGFPLPSFPLEIELPLSPCDPLDHHHHVPSYM